MDSIVHFEISAKDLNRSRKFYEQAFDWQTPPWTDGYAMAITTDIDAQQRPTKPGAINGGLQLADKGSFKGISVTLGVVNIEKALDRVQAAGGSVVEKRRPVGDVGFVAYVKDPDGNVLGLWEEQKA